MTQALYFIGTPRRSAIRHDNGFLDQFQPRAPTRADRRNYAKWQALLELAETAQHVPGMPKNDIQMRSRPTGIF